MTAFAKVNFILNLLDKRPDGYHGIESIMQAVELHDDVSVVWRGEKPDGNAAGFRIILDPGSPELPSGESNLAFGAALRMKEAFSPNAAGTLYIKIVKRIPVAAGLAGGSSDAAAVCTALGKIWSIPMKDWMPVAAGLGSDVPFCAWAQNGTPAALARGTGTELTAVEPADCRLLLVNPGYPLSAKEVYGAYDIISESKTVIKPKESAGSGCAQWIAAQGLPEKLAHMNNDLQPAALQLRPGLGEIFKELRSLSPVPLAVQLSGSGPTVFAVYPPDGPVPEGYKVFSTCL